MATDNSVIDITEDLQLRDLRAKYLRLSLLAEEHEASVKKNPISHLNRLCAEIYRLKKVIEAAYLAINPPMSFEIDNIPRNPNIAADMFARNRAASAILSEEVFK